MSTQPQAPTASGKKAKYRYWLTFLLDDLPVGEKFQPGLLHLTLIPWFVTEKSERELKESFLKTYGSQKPVSAVLAKKAFLGPKRNVSVSLIKPSKQIQQLHNLSLKLFDQLPARWAVKNPHAGKDYQPHIRRRRGVKLVEGQAINLNLVYLIKATRHEDNIRQVAAKVLLNA